MTTREKKLRLLELSCPLFDLRAIHKSKSIHNKIRTKLKYKLNNQYNMIINTL